MSNPLCQDVRMKQNCDFNQAKPRRSSQLDRASCNAEIRAAFPSPATLSQFELMRPNAS
jgi:hypothetical protein